MGSTSSKVAVFDDDKEIFTETINHDQKFLAEHKIPLEQYDVRKADIYKALADNGFKFEEFDAVCSRAGVIRSVQSGTYLINEQCVADAKDLNYGGMQPHGLGLLIADAVAKEYGIPAFFCDPVSTDEMSEVAKMTGIKGVRRPSHFHALNQKAVARKCAEVIGKPYEELNLIGVHLGGGTSIAAHEHGKCVDLTCCTDDGPMAMDRPGEIPNTHLINLCYDSGMTKTELKRMLKQEVGVFSYTNSKDMRSIKERMYEGDELCKQAFDGFIYGHCKYVGAMAAILKFKVDGIFITGGIAHGEDVINAFKEYIGSIAPIYVFPGENEMQSLAEGALRVLRGEAEALVYTAE